MFFVSGGMELPVLRSGILDWNGPGEPDPVHLTECPGDALGLDVTATEVPLERRRA
jgi:hypothetical protein